MQFTVGTGNVAIVEEPALEIPLPMTVDLKKDLNLSIKATEAL